MIPIKDKNEAATVPYVMYFIMALNIIVYIIDSTGAANEYFSRLWNWAMVPAGVISDIRPVPVLDNLGHLVGYQNNPAIGPHPQWITIFTSMFMHGGFLHIAGNMLYLWIFGNNIEDKLGHFKFLIFYLVCGVAAALSHILVASVTGNMMTPTVGASGAIAGVLGAYLILFPQAKIRTILPIFFFVTFVNLPALIVLGFWFLAQLSGIMSCGGQVGGGVAYGAHIGGFLMGMLWIHLAGKDKLLRNRKRSTIYDSETDTWI